MTRHHRDEPSDLRQDYDALALIAKERRAGSEPDRRDYVIRELTARGFAPAWDEAAKAVTFTLRGNTITVYPYKGWFSGKGVKDGRGIRKLLKQLDR